MVPKVMSRTTLTVLAGALILLGGCLEHPVKNLVLYKGTSTSPDCTFAPSNDVDILFVIDNSGSMGEEQALLANSFGAFIDVLEAKHVRANYRIGVTTTDNGNPWCPEGTPEGGNLVMSSCKDRLDDFSFGDGQADARDIACNDICTLEAQALEILPTTTEYDQQAAPRPWLESIDGIKNIPATTDMGEAFKCFGPQGINGCGFESPLESMYLALVRSQANTEASYGFLRSSAILAVVFVTDEADCSYNKAFSEVFEQDGDRLFWSDPVLSYPTSALCWNAGVTCSGDPSGYDSCDAVNKDVSGREGVDDEFAVLHPMSRYIGLLDHLEQQKQQLNAQQEVIVALIGGVGADGAPSYRDVADTNPDFQAGFGIGPGCEAANPGDPDAPVQAVPPVRLRELVDSFTPGNMFSICEPNYADALAEIAKTLEDQIMPACFTLCVDDIDKTTPLVEPECTVEQHPPGGGSVRPVAECLTANQGYMIDAETGDYVMPSDDVDVCYAMLTDRQAQIQTATTSDDMSERCEDSNYNLEFVIARRPGFPVDAGTWMAATCTLADFPAVSCPGIGR
jgi:hypothetical protein